MIEGFQHVGIGVSDMERSKDFYKRVLGFSVTLNDHEAEMDEMVSIIGSLERMRVAMAMNLCGGAAVELVQHTSSEPRPLPEALRWGDIGYLSAGVKAYGIEKLVEMLEGRGAGTVSPIVEMPVEQGGTWRSAFLHDPDGILIELLETAELRAAGGKPRVGGFSHVTIGVEDMAASLGFYSGILSYDLVASDTVGPPPEVEPVAGGQKVRTVMLKRSRRPKSDLPLEGGMVRLVQALDFKGNHLYEGRRWGDIGLMEMALDVSDASETYSLLCDAGAAAFCPPTTINMGMGSVGTFSYVKDPDDNIVETVEVDKLGFLPPKAVAPLMKALLKLRSRF